MVTSERRGMASVAKLPARRSATRLSTGDLLLRIYVGVFMAFLMAPLVVVVIVSFEPAKILRFPPSAFSLRWYQEVLGGNLFLQPAYNSLILAVLATVAALLLGAPAAHALVRYRFPGRDLASSLLLSPLIVPQLVIGISLLQVYGAFRVPASLMTLLIGHIVITIPYIVRTLSATLMGLDPSIEEAAASLGANRFQVFRLVILPLVRSGLFAAMIFAFLISFDNAVISLFLVSARTGTLPIAIFNYVEHSLDPTIAAVSTIIMANSLVLMVVLHKLGRLDKVGM